MDYIRKDFQSKFSKFILKTQFSKILKKMYQKRKETKCLQ